MITRKSSTGPIVEPLPYQNWQTLLTRWPTNQPIISLIGNDHWSILATQFTQVSWEQTTQREDLLSIKPSRKVEKIADGTPLADLPFISGFIGLVTYDAYAPFVCSPTSDIPRIYRISEALIVHSSKKKLYRVSEREGNSSEIVKMICANSPHPGQLTIGNKWETQERESSHSYLGKVQRVLDDILSGRYYQLNLLRQFNLVGSFERSILLDKLIKHSETHSAWFDFPDYKVLSFSPERFCRIEVQQDLSMLHTLPIKGTIAREHRQQEDLLAAQTLLNSHKDLAELHMIIELMRNDLHKVCTPHSVKVLAKNQLLSFRHVHHLQGHVVGQLKHGLTLHDLFSALCPAGSISGVPKKEVTQGIAELETDSRGYMMGHAFYVDDRGGFDSSVLIRTISARPDKENHWQGRFAAGGGLTLGSQPEKEMEEIRVKQSVIENENGR